MGSKALALQIAKMSSEEVKTKLAEAFATPWKLPTSESFQWTLPKTTDERLSALRMANPASAMKLEAQLRALNPPQVKPPPPIPWNKYEKYLPKPIIDHIKAEYDRRVDHVNRTFDPAPFEDLFNRLKLEQVITAKEQVAKLSEEYDKITPELDKINQLIDELPDLTVEELLLRNPSLDAEIQQEIADSEWAPEGRMIDEEHHH